MQRFVFIKPRFFTKLKSLELIFSHKLLGISTKQLAHWISVCTFLYGPELIFLPKECLFKYLFESQLGHLKENIILGKFLIKAYINEK